MNVIASNRIVPWILATASLLSGCDSLSVLADKSKATFAKLKEPKKDNAGFGLDRTSFGELSSKPIVPGELSCRPESAPEEVRKFTRPIDSVIDRVLASTMNDPDGVALDPTLKKEELDQYFALTNTKSKTLIRVLKRTDRSIDFWFRDGAVEFSSQSAKAAEDYCKNHDNTQPKYVGYAARCGKPWEIPFITVHEKKTGKKIPLIVYPEERIVAFDCQ